MNILITGYKGFIGSNLVNKLRQKEGHDIDGNTLLLFDKDDDEKQLELMCSQCDFIFHLAAVVRPTDPLEYSTNKTLTKRLLSFLSEANNRCPIVFSSSIQVALDNEYSKCKKFEENLLQEFGASNGSKVFIYRFPNLFGRFSRPNYTSVISTFCYNTSHGIPITINDPSTLINFAFIDDVLDQVLSETLYATNSGDSGIRTIINTFSIGLGKLAYYMELLKRGDIPESFRNDCFLKKLQETYDWFSNYSL